VHMHWAFVKYLTILITLKNRHNLF
jgi:hypothetical protein